MSIILQLPKASKKLTRKETFPPFFFAPLTTACNSLGMRNRNKHKCLREVYLYIKELGDLAALKWKGLME